MASIGATITAHELRLLPRTVESVRYYVDELHVLIDDRAPAEVVAYCRAVGLACDLYQWRDDFADAVNAGCDRLHSEWVLELDSDETLTHEHAVTLRAAVAGADDAGHDLLYLPRRHWCDLAMRTPYAGFPYPDFQPRLHRPHVRHAGCVHPVAVGFRSASHSAVEIQHFNTALRTDADWARVNAYYAELGRRRVAP